MKRAEEEGNDKLARRGGRGEGEGERKIGGQIGIEQIKIAFPHIFSHFSTPLDVQT